MIYVFYFLQIINFVNILCLEVKSVDLSNNVFLWNGFNHFWERKIFGFLTPHRIGSIGNSIINQYFSDNEAKADFEIQFTPGVNGDYAFPKSRFTIIYSNETMFLKSMITFNFTDEADHSENPSAHSIINDSFAIPGFNITQTVLNGFNINMKCIDTNCNSNGVWPSKLIIDISNCQSDKCDLHFELNRGWTPLKGGGRAFNYKMSYEIELQLLTIIHKEDFSVYNDIINLNSTIHNGLVSGIRNISTKYNEHAIGITAFGFELEKYGIFNDLGRYIGGVNFEIGNIKISKNEVSYEYMLNLSAAKFTVINSDVKYLLKTKIFSLNNIKLETDMEIKGKVCKDDYSTIFLCKMKGLEDRQKDTIRYLKSLK